MLVGALAASLLASACSAPAGAADPSTVARGPFVAVRDAEVSAPCTDGDACRRTVAFGGKKVDFYASHSLMQPNSALDRVVLVVHGKGGGASSNFVTLVKSAARAENGGVARHILDTTLLIAPYFPVEAPDDYYSWGTKSWLAGERTPGEPSVSSYEILDRLVVELTRSGRFPKIRSITLAGHSAGGQLVQRYAAVSRAEDELPPGVHMRYVAANPGTYLYLRPERPYFDERREGFAIPFSAAGVRAPGFRGAPKCAEKYDRWKYGLSRLNDYAARVGAERIVQNATSRDVTILVGQDDADLDCSDSDAPPGCEKKLEANVQDLERTCQAQLQGRDRLARARHHAAFMARYFPGNRQKFIEIPGVHHASRAMFESEEGVRALFAPTRP